MYVYIYIYNIMYSVFIQNYNSSFDFGSSSECWNY